MNSHTNLTKLNPSQREAVLHNEGPLLILAGAGSGKTSTMAHRMAHLMTVHGVSGQNILGLSFTRKAARELSERIARLAPHHRTPKVSTFHALCAQILRENAETLGYPKNFVILDAQDQKDILKAIFRQVRIDDRKFDLDRVSSIVSKMKSGEVNRNALSNAGWQDDYYEAALAVSAHYQEELLRQGAMDFEDLLRLTQELFSKHPAIAENYSGRYRYILVDEYQDTNATQFSILRHLTSLHKNICVVGDDDQSIYAWRGADPTHILEFRSHFPGARLITLEQNYRSTNVILQAANVLISNNKKRHPKKLWSQKGEGEKIRILVCEDDRAEADTVADEILKLKDSRQIAFSEFAILMRSNPQTRIFEESLRSRRIPYELVGSMSFLERKEVKDVLSYWKLVANPKDESSLRRVINWPARGIGKKTLTDVHELAVKNGVSFYDALQSYSKDQMGAASQKITDFFTLIEELKANLLASSPTGVGLSAWARGTLDQIGIKAAHLSEFDSPEEAEKRTEMAYELANAIGQGSELSDGAIFTAAGPMGALSDFLSKMALREIETEDPNEKDKQSNQVHVMTMHQAKGLEFRVTFLVGMEEGLLPHQRSLSEATENALAEERRLAYVGVTRAKESLILTYTKHRIRYGKKVPRYPSRFLAEMPLGGDSPEISKAPSQEAHNEKAHEARVKDFLSEMKKRLSNPG